jgi:Na+-translocating ferredoxin:NAD+ oxidoreductase RnfG subunit
LTPTRQRCSQQNIQQAKIDTALEALDQLANKEINGRRFFDGSANYTFAGRDSAQVSNIRVYSMRDTQFSGTVTSAATQAQVTYNGKVGALVQSDATFQLTGERGSATLKVGRNRSPANASNASNLRMKW